MKSGFLACFGIPTTQRRFQNRLGAKRTKTIFSAIRRVREPMNLKRKKHHFRVKPKIVKMRAAEIRNRQPVVARYLVSADVENFRLVFQTLVADNCRCALHWQMTRETAPAIAARRTFHVKHNDVETLLFLTAGAALNRLFQNVRHLIFLRNFVLFLLFTGSPDVKLAADRAVVNVRLGAVSGNFFGGSISPPRRVFVFPSAHLEFA
jgi:hypothetical protein